MALGDLRAKLPWETDLGGGDATVLLVRRTEQCCFFDPGWGCPPREVVRGTVSAAPDCHINQLGFL